MIKTRITEMLGIKYPILKGGMQWLSKAELVAAVSEAGGLGFISAASFASAQDLVKEIRKTKNLTQKPFGVNISMLPEVVKDELTNEFVAAMIAEKIPVVETSGRSPEPIVPILKQAGVKIIHKVTAARYAIKAEQVGADAVIVVGYEAGGHPGLDEVGTFVNLPKAVQSVKIPVIAAGGVCDARSFIAALALGAEGIMMGTRFIAVKECIAHQNLKNWMIQAKETDTIITQRSIRNAFRGIRNNHSYIVLGMEESGATLKELLPVIGGNRGRISWSEGLLDGASIPMGQDVGLINNVTTVKELINEIIQEAEEIMDRLNILLAYKERSQ